MKDQRKVSDKAKEVAGILLSLGSVQLNVGQPYTWVSGIKSPIYCDNRRVNSDVKARNALVDIFKGVINRDFPEVEIIAGVATGGMPLGILIADRMGLPFVYVRQEPKEHGLKRQVEGEYSKGDKVVLIEDLVSTGKSSLKAIEGIWNAELELLGLISIMTYGFPASVDLFARNHVNFMSLCDLDAVLEVAFDQGILTQEEKASILKFRAAPAQWGSNN